MNSDHFLLSKNGGKCSRIRRFRIFMFPANKFKAAIIVQIHELGPFFTQQKLGEDGLESDDFSPSRFEQINLKRLSSSKFINSDHFFSAKMGEDTLESDDFRHSLGTLQERFRHTFQVYASCTLRGNNPEADKRATQGTCMSRARACRTSWICTL